MVKSAVQVAIRIRPSDNFAHECIKLEGKSVSLYISKKKRKDDFVNNQQENFSYKYDAVLHNASQEAVYSEVGQKIVSSIFEGYNGTILAYGQTGAGKTYTMSGGNDFKQRGVIPRAIAQVFNEITNKPELAFEVRVSYMEIYQEKLIDLLAGDNFADSPDLQIQEDPRQGISVKGLAMKACSSEADALSFFFEGNTNRAVSEHALNANSTRSHTVFSIYLSSRSRVESEGRTVHSKLHCVDLAGSERLSKTGSEGTTAKEAMYINKSLTFLEQVVIALTAQSRDHIPYRQSRLTNLLKDSLGGNCKTVMIANIWGEDAHLEETSSTLRFASRMMRVHNDPTVNVTIDPEAQIRKMAKEIAELKSELQMQNQLHGKSHITYVDEFTDEERFELQKLVRDYIANRVSDIDVKSLRQMKEIFKIFKGIVETTELEVARTKQASRGTTGTAGNKGSRSDMGAADDIGVGEVDAAGGVGVGTAFPAKLEKQPAEGRPPMAPAMAKLSAPTVGAATAGPKEDATVGFARTVQVAQPDRNQAFEDYKMHDGADFAETLRRSQQSLKEKKRQFKELAQKVNDVKAEIDRLRMMIEQRKQEADDDEDVVDVEYFRALTALKEQKNAYRQAYDLMQTVKTEKDYETRLVEQARQRLVVSFTEWYDRTFEGGSSGLGGTVSGFSSANSTMMMPPIGTGSIMKQSKSAHLQGTAAADSGGEALDEGERFDQLEMQRIMNTDPESAIYYNAKKAVAVVQKSGGGVTKKMVAAKRQHLVK